MPYGQNRIISLDQTVDTSAYNGTLSPFGVEGLQTKYTLLNNASTIFGEKWREYWNNYNMYIGNQWDEKKARAIRLQGRDPIKLNITSPILDHIAGEFASNPTQWKLFPGDRASAIKTELAEKAMNAVAQANDFFAHQKKEVFADGVIGNMGVIGQAIDSVNAETERPKLFRCDPMEFMFDPVARTYNQEDARWLYRRVFRTFPEAMILYPGQEDVLNKYISWLADDWTAVMPWFELGNMAIYDQHYIPISEFYERRLFVLYALLDPNDQETPVTQHNSQEEVWAEYKRRQMMYQIQARQTGQQPQQMAIQTMAVPKIVETCFIGWDILDERVLDQEFYPYTFFFPYFWNGQFWAYTDKLTDAQVFYNKQLSQMEYQIGVSAKGAVIVDVTGLAEGWTFEDFRRNYPRTGAIIPKKHGYKAEDLVHQLEQGGFHPQMLELAMQAIRNVNTTYPEATYSSAPMGAQGGAPTQSGRAIEGQKQNTAISTKTLYDNWQYTEQLAGEKLLYMIQHNTSKPIDLQLFGPIGDMEWVSLNTSPASTLYDEKFIVTVSAADYSATNRAQQHSEIDGLFASPVFQSLMQMNPLVAIPLYKAWVITLNVSNEIKQDLLQGMFTALQLTPAMAGMAPGGPNSGVPQNQLTA